MLLDYEPPLVCRLFMFNNVRLSMQSVFTLRVQYLWSLLYMKWLPWLLNDETNHSNRRHAVGRGWPLETDFGKQAL